MADTDMTYSTIKKIDKVKEQIRLNTNVVKESKLENKLYKLFKELAEEMIDSVQYLINHMGGYENAGWEEAEEFMKMVDGCRANIIIPLRHNLQDYIESLISRLHY